MINWLQGTVALLFGLVIVFKAIPILIRIAYEKDLYDKPDGDRKVHTRYIPTFGGVAIFIAIILAYSFSGFGNVLPWTPYLLGGLTALFFCGLKDDLIGLSPTKKLIIEVTVCIAVLVGSGNFIYNFGGVFGLQEIPQALAFTISLFTMIVVINSYNLIDGIDGLAGGIGAIASASFALGFWMAGEISMAYLALLTSVVLIGYLFHNFHPASIFMGDTGSLVIGFLLSIFAVRFVTLSQEIAFSNVFGSSSPVLTVAILTIPLYDTIRAFVRRIRRGESPFHADSDHIHHTLLKLGWGQRRTVLYLYFAAIAIVLTAFASSKFNVNISLFITLVMSFILLPTNGFKRKIADRLGLNPAGILRKQQEAALYEHLREAQEKTRRTSKDNQKISS